MFEDSLISCGISSLRQRGWPAIASFAIQATFVAALIVVPMLFTDALPLRVIKVAEIPAPPGLTPLEPIASTPRTRQQPTIPKEVIQVPRSIPRGVIQVVDPPSVSVSRSESGQSDSIGAGTGDRNSQIADLFNFTRTITPTVVPPPSKRWRVSGGVEQGLLIEGTKPVYPPLARQTGIQGEVILQAVIGKDGRIENLRAIGGNPFLVKAALEAVRQWRYRPYLLNGDPVEVETQITVIFKVS